VDISDEIVLFFVGVLNFGGDGILSYIVSSLLSLLEESESNLSVSTRLLKLL